MRIHEVFYFYTMQYDASTPQDYLSSISEDWRKQTLIEIREIIQSKGPELREGTQYKMLGYFLNEVTVFQLNAQKNYVSLYVGDHRKIDPAGELLEGLNVGKGCIRFSKSVKVANTRIDEFIEKTMDKALMGKDIDC
jgi:uncharacterized protein YdhG (YjbR/CyaY superfamily)